MRWRRGHGLLLIVSFVVDDDDTTSTIFLAELTISDLVGTLRVNWNTASSVGHD